MEKIKRWEKVSNGQVLERIGNKRTLINSTQGRRANVIGHNLKWNCPLHDAIEGQMTKVKRVGRRTQFLDDMRGTEEDIGS